MPIPDTLHLTNSPAYTGSEKGGAIATGLGVVVLAFVITWNADVRNKSIKRTAIQNSIAVQQAALAPPAITPPKSGDDKSTTLFGWNSEDVRFFGTIVAAIIGGWVTYIGHSFSKRHNDRTHDLTRIDTLIKWVGSLGTPSGTPSSPNQRFAALVVLAKSGHVDLALACLESMWSQNPRIPGAGAYAVSVINEGLRSGNRDIEDYASRVLYSNVEKLTASNGNYSWPACVDRRWKANLSLYSKDLILRSLLRLILAEDNWPIEDLRDFFKTLCSAMKDKESTVKVGAALAAEVILPYAKGQDDDEAGWINIAGDVWTAIPEIEDNVAQARSSSDGNSTTPIYHLIKELEAKYPKPASAPQIADNP